MVRAMKPAWLGKLMEETSFFSSCGAHDHRRKNDKNIFCLTCCHNICPHCVPSHRSHPLLQVRRYLYHNVIRLDDLQKLIDCSYIQPYTINGAKVIFLKERPQSRPAACKGSSNFCSSCDRILQEPFHFCSLSCKVNYMVFQGEDLSSVLQRFELSDFAYYRIEGIRMDSMEMEEDGHTSEHNMLEETCNNSATGGTSISQEENVVKKKANGFLPGIVLSFGNRRKRAPQRSPLS